MAIPETVSVSRQRSQLDSNIAFSREYKRSECSPYMYANTETVMVAIVVVILLLMRSEAGDWVRLLFVGCLTSQQHASVSQGRICTGTFMFCHTEIEVVDQTFYLTQSQYTDTWPTSPSTDPITPGAWQGSRLVTGMTRPRKNPGASGIRTGIFRSRGGRLSH